MKWNIFYTNFYDWNASTIIENISLLEEIGEGHEVADAIMKLEHEQLKAQLLNKAIKLHVEFTYNDFLLLNDELDEESIETLKGYTGLNRNDPTLDESQLTWETFYKYYINWDDETINNRALLIKETPPIEELLAVLSWISDDTYRTNFFKTLILKNAYTMNWNVFADNYYNMPEDILQYLITHLDSFGPSKDICEVIQHLPTSELGDMLYDTAIKNKVKFSEEELAELEKL